MDELDKLTLITRKFIKKNRSKLVDNLFQRDPLFGFIHLGYEDDGPDPFDEWVKEVRAIEEAIDSINGS